MLTRKRPERILSARAEVLKANAALLKELIRHPSRYRVKRIECPKPKNQVPTNVDKPFAAARLRGDE